MAPESAALDNKAPESTALASLFVPSTSAPLGTIQVQNRIDNVGGTNSFPPALIDLIKNQQVIEAQKGAGTADLIAKMLDIHSKNHALDK